jgi:hypothetical protein
MSLAEAAIAAEEFARTMTSDRRRRAVPQHLDPADRGAANRPMGREVEKESAHLVRDAQELLGLAGI